jgi:hypothetical protein
MTENCYIMTSMRISRPLVTKRHEEQHMNNNNKTLGKSPLRYFASQQITYLTNRVNANQHLKISTTCYGTFCNHSEIFRKDVIGLC